MGPKISELANDPTYGGNTDNTYTKKYGMQEGKYYVPQREIAGMDPWATPQAYENSKDFFQTGTSWSNSVNVAQGLDKGSYSFSLGNTTSKGVIPTTGLDRYNVKLAAESKLHHNWTTGFSGNFVNSKITKQTTANDGVLATVYGAPPSYDLAGILYHDVNDPYSQNTFRSTSSFNAAYWAVNNNSFTERTNRFFGNAYVNYSTKFGTDNHSLNVKYQLGEDAYNTIYTNIWGYGSSNSSGEIQEYSYTINETNSLFTVMYNWNINEE